MPSESSKTIALQCVILGNRGRHFQSAEFSFDERGLSAWHAPPAAATAPSQSLLGTIGQI
ncbi:hypothetical protein ATC00_05235 [Sinorhizobium americanum]|nr:hypothetical protein ATC00_05235 [Sinorhizobium americanum]